MTSRLQFADWVPFPVPRVFLFFCNLENLPRLMPPETRTRVDGLHLVSPPPSPEQGAILTHHAAGTGSIIETSFRALPCLAWRSKWTAVITGFEWNHHFADAQQKGPFQKWHHRHEFVEETRDGFGGTLVRDVIEYEVGFGPLGALANAVFVEAQVRRIFAHRQKVLPDLLS